MAVHQLVVTLGTTAAAATATSLSVRWARIESETSNADVKIGDSALSSTVYGAIVTAGPTNAVTIAPGDGSLCISLNNLYLLGTSTQKVHIMYVL